MPSRSIPTPQSPPLITPSPTQSYHHRPPLPSRLVAPIAAASTAAFSLLLCLLVCFRKITRKRTVPSDSKPPHRYSYSVLRRATNSFSPANRLGQGGFGSVFRGTLPASPNNQEQKQIAVKVMDSGSLQGEREFQNELLLASKLESDYVVSVLGFSSDRKRRRMLLVYELMSNVNLQDGLMHKKLPELSEWKKRFSVAVDIAKGIEYLHGLNQPVIHGDIKPSNILLDQYFSVRIADFGLSRLKEEEKNVDQCEITVVDDGKMNGGGLEAAAAAKNVELESNGGDVVEDYGSVVEETDSVTTTGVEDFNLVVDESPESFIRASPSELLEKGSTSEANVDNAKTSGKEIVRNGVVKDYVMEWIGTEIKKERPKSDWIAATAAAAAAAASASSSNGVSTKLDKKKNKKRLDWWMSLDDDDDKENNSKSFKKEKRRPAREWWKEEYCEELAKKKKKKKKKRKMGISSDEDWWPRDEEMYVEKKKSRSRSRSKGSRGSVDWWIDGLSGELFKGRHNSHDSGSVEIPKSGGISSTPSMRGTVCYIAPEYGGGGDLSEKCDVYSFGVLLLVLISGRRPLQVTGSPMSEFQRANLLSWARHLARNGKLIDLVDKAVQSLDREQALLCITVALLCLQKSPARRPSMKEVVAMLTGESQPPQLPTELSPSPPSRLPHKLHKKGR